MVGYNIPSMNQGSLTGVKVLMRTTSFMTLNERVLLVLDGDEFEISIMEMKPDFRPLLTTIKHSIDAQTLYEESCSEFAISDEATTVGTKFTDPGGDYCATDITLTEQQKANTESDFALILCQEHTGSTNSLDNTDTIFKTTCLFPETKVTHNLQTKDQQLHVDTYQPPSAVPHYDKVGKNTQEVADSDSNTDASADSITGVGLVKKGITGHSNSQVKGTRLINKAIDPSVLGLNTSSAQVSTPSSKIARTLNLDQNQLQNFFSAFILDLAEPQEVVEMELKERKKKKLRQIRRLGPKSSYRKGKKVMKDKPALAHDDISEVVPELIATSVTDSYKNTSLKDTGSSPVTKSTVDKNEDVTSNNASIDEEASDTHVCLPAPLSFQCSQKASSEAVKENTRDVRSKTRKQKLLQASGSVANTTKKGVSYDSLNSGIKQGNVQFQTACKNNQANGFDREKETQEMLYDATTLGLGCASFLIILMQAFYTQNFDFSEAGFIRINQIGTFSKYLFKKKSIPFCRHSSFYTNKNTNTLNEFMEAS